MNRVEKIIICLILTVFTSCDSGGPFDNRHGGPTSVKSSKKNDQPQFASSKNDNSANTATTASTEESNQSNKGNEKQYFASANKPKLKIDRNTPVLVKSTPKPANKTKTGDEAVLRAKNNSNKSVVVSKLRRETTGADFFQNEFLTRASKGSKKKKIQNEQTSPQIENFAYESPQYESFRYQSPRKESISGFWLLENAEGKIFELFITDMKGTLRVSFIFEKKELSADQDVAVRKTEGGFLVTGSNVKFSNNYKNTPVYKGDKLFFEFQSDKSFKVFEYQGDTRKPVRVKNHFSY